jgi:hypothetical protein
MKKMLIRGSPNDSIAISTVLRTSPRTRGLALRPHQRATTTMLVERAEALLPLPQNHLLVMAARVSLT